MIKWKKDVYESCPYCGCQEYYYQQSVYGKVTSYHSFPGHEVDNGDMYDGLSYRKPVGKIRCRYCNRILGEFKGEREVSADE